MNPFDQAWIVLKMGAVGRGTGNPRRPNAGTRTKWAREIHNLMREHDKVGRVIDHTNKDSGYRHAAGMIIHHPDDKDMNKGYDDRRVLWLRRSTEEDSMHGLWELPGGKVEGKHRNPQHTAEEEVMEESGLPVSNVESMGHHIDDNMQKVYHGFVGDAKHTDVKLPRNPETGVKEHDAYIWASQNQMFEQEGRLHDGNPLQISHHANHFFNEPSHYGEGSRYDDSVIYGDSVTSMTSPAMSKLQAHPSQGFENSQHMVGSIANDYGYDWDGTNMTRQS
jgi:8-oxo-dGTP pyrophosphatase MutT (NUDIX family)|tara:strand:- start:2944 stop:3777 length:834 start_codon:yes stop_codon:yes gene_type:complete